MYKQLLLSTLSILSINAVIAQSTNPAPYCDASFDDPTFAIDDHISDISFGTLRNQSAGHFAAPHYVFYNNLNTEQFTVDSAYELKVTFTARGGCGYGVWIDYNQNNIFEAEEKIAGTVGNDILDLDTGVVITKTITIPSDAKLGKTRMRVRIVEDDNFIMNSSEILACNASASAVDVMDWGETEDYEIEIVNPSSTSIKSATNADKINIYPNPSSKQFTVNADIQINAVKVYNNLGQVVFNQAGTNNKQMTIQHELATGMYILAVETASGINYQKVQVVK